MKNLRLIPTIIAGSVLLTAAPAMAADIKAGANANTSATTTLANKVDADKLINQNVTNGAGDTIGDIESILLDEKGNTAAVVIGVGGFLGIGEREVAVRWDSLNISDNGDTVTTNLTKAQLERLPEYRYSNAEMRGKAFRDDYYGVYTRETRARDRDLRADARDVRVMGPAGEIRATNFVGTDVKNSQNETVGEIEEILIGKNGKLQAVVSVGGFLGIGDREVAVDWDQMKIAREKDDDLVVMMSTPKATLEKMPEYDREK